MDACVCCDLEKPMTVAMNCHPDIVVCSDCLDWLVRRRDRGPTASAGPARVVAHDAVFSVVDVARSRDHYERLGFVTHEHDETYAFAQRDNVTIHLARNMSEPIGSTLYLHVSDADSVAAAWRTAGLEVDGPRDEDYGKREGVHVDLDGNTLRFGSPLRDP